MDGSRRTIGLVLLGLLAFGLRAWVVFALSTEHTRPLDYEHGRIAENLLAGKGFSIEFLGQAGPTSQQAPFYPLLLAAFYKTLGVHSAAAILGVELLQCLAGAALTLAVVWLGWSLLPDQRGIGWIAGFMEAIHPSHLYMVTHLQVAIWAALGLTLLLAIAASPRSKATWRGAALTGLVAGVLLLVEPILALALPVAAALFWFGAYRAACNGPHRGAFARASKQVALMAGVALLVITPWTVRNWLIHGEPVFIKTTFGYAFWQGNSPGSWGTDKVPKAAAEAARLDNDGTLRGVERALWEARYVTVYIDDLSLKPTGYRDFAGLSEPARSRLLLHRAWQFIHANPAVYLHLCLKRLQYFLLFDETNPKASHWLYRITTVVWLVLAVVGALVSWPHRRRLWPTYAVFLAVMLFHTLVIVSARFRIPVEPLSLLWAAAAVAPLVARAEELAIGGWCAVATRGAGSRRRTSMPAPSSPEGRPANALPGPHFLTRSAPPGVRR
jgi:4-amino-4-deoxy-L-arabinose transferase-like glycosyltransferase